MNPLSHLAPMAALIIAQFGENESKLAVYGPMGVICLWLMYREEKTRGDMRKTEENVRKDNSALRDEIRGVAHQMKGLNRNLLYITATHGPDGLRQVAERELQREPGGE